MIVSISVQTPTDFMTLTPSRSIRSRETMTWPIRPMPTGGVWRIPVAGIRLIKLKKVASGFGVGAAHGQFKLA